MASSPIDQERFSNLVTDLRKNLTELKTYVDNLLREVRNEDVERDKGISLLELKCHLMLDYLTNLSYISLRKLSGKSINGDEAIFRLAEIRTVLERIRPTEQKLQYQIDKLVNSALNSDTSKDGLSYRPNPGALEGNNDEEESDESDNETDAGPDGRKASTKKYVPPKLVAMPYAEEGDKANTAMEKVRKRALSSSLIRDLQEQYGEGPEEIMQTETAKRKDQESEKERTRYEEENFIRLQMTKAQKKSAKRSAAKSTLDSLLSFGDYHVDDLPQKKQRKRTISKGKGRGKGKGKRK